MGFRRAWKGEEWQAFALQLVQRRHGPENVQIVPDSVGGDAGLEFFTTNGCLYQCYAPKEVSDVKKAASAMKAKAGRDLPKLSKNKDKIEAILSGISVNRWILLCPFLDNKDAAMVRKGRRAAHPLQHILLRELLDGLSTVPAVQPFGRGPWVCRNSMADHFGHPVIARVRLRRDGDVVYGDFACECGYLYTRTRSANGEVGKPRYRRFGPLLVPALKASLSRGDSLRSTAASLGIDPKTLMREAATAGIEVPWNTAPSGKVPMPRSESTKRKRKSACRRRPKCNWRGIDTDLSAAARQAASEVLAQTPPVRVTRASLERRVVSKDWIQKRSGKLPKAVRTIDELAETTDGFRSRRLAWQAKQAFAAGDLRPCEIQRKAGLPTAWLPRIKTMIENARLDGRPLT